MARLVEWIDRLKLVEGAVIIGGVWVAGRTLGIWRTVAVLAIALLLFALYAWWRRKGIFRNRA